MCGRQVGAGQVDRWQLDSKTAKFFSETPGKGNFVNKNGNANY